MDNTLHLLLDITMVAVSILMLWKGSDWMVDAASHIAHRFNISDFVIGFTVVAIGTSAPEFAVTISGVLTGHEDISVGNIVGSNIFNLGFILGGTALLVPIVTSPKIVYRDGTFLIAVTVLLYLLMFGFNFNPNKLINGELNRWDGILMVSILLIYIAYLMIKREPPDEEVPAGRGDWKDFIILIVGIGLVVGGGHFLVKHSVSIASSFGVSKWVIGVTIVAAGTSAPEFATSLTAVIKKKHGMAIGNLIGSDLFNLLGVLGLAGILSPLTEKGYLLVEQQAQISMMVLVGFVILVVIMMRLGWVVSRVEGGLLVLFNLCRWILDFMGQR